MKKVIAILALVIAAASVNAQSSSTASQTVTLTLQNSIAITVGTASGTSFTFNTTDQYRDGITNTSASTFNVKSNRPWNVTVSAATANFNATTATPMPSSVLGVRLNGGTTFTQLSTSAASFAAGARGNSDFTVDYNANPLYSYDAGTYTLSVVYTATQQ